jgi:eukaryotic-like serine/threonine-protein kinase
VTDLRAEDPATLGPYTMVSRLGEGGMGSVFLAHDPSGRPVAVKMIRRDLAADPDFRRRFRGEVERARQVPPFCTAEVLDADPDHEMPYLVVEYVDGPSLATVLEERGPLTPSNLHGVAIGVATALTAIHGAGVVHRDLKPNNVLLAPGSPKVIDFGIARWVDGATANTRPNQLMGTVPYMAPERFDGEPDRSLGPASDVFAWGAVVVVAGTGRTPFAAATPASVATRILTAEPDLGSLHGPLRDLVIQCLAKDPAQRPTARDLLDELLAGKRHNLAAALARQPALRVAVEGAQAATDHQVTAAVPAAPGTGPDTTRLPPARTEPADAERATTRFVDPAASGTQATAVSTGPGPAPHPAPHPAPEPPARGRRRVVAALVALLVLATAGIVGGIFTGHIRVGGSPDTTAGSGPPAPGGTATREPATAGSVLPGGRRVVSDTLAVAREWQVRNDEQQQATCDFAAALVVTRRTAGTYRCPGPVTPVGDLAAFVDVRLRATGNPAKACAGIWFRFDADSGYLLRICAEGITLAIHRATAQPPIEVLREWPGELAVDVVARIGVAARGDEVTVYRDGQPVGSHTDSQFGRGRVVLGIAADAGRGPFTVSFANVEVYAA